MNTATIITTVVCSVLGSTGIATLITFLINRSDSRKATDLCLLRSNILQIWLDCRESETISQYQLQNLEALAECYYNLGGNSFVKNIVSECEDYKII